MENKLKQKWTQEQEQLWLCLRILAEYVPSEPKPVLFGSPEWFAGIEEEPFE